jgi:hypothetical protein
MVTKWALPLSIAVCVAFLTLAFGTLLGHWEVVRNTRRTGMFFLVTAIVILTLGIVYAILVNAGVVPTLPIRIFLRRML